MDFSISEMNFRITGLLNELQTGLFATAQGVLQMHTSQKNRIHPPTKIIDELGPKLNAFIRSTK